MIEPGYQSQSPNREYVYQDIMGHFNGKLNKKNWASSIMNQGYLSLLVKEKMMEEYDQCGGFGSYRGYATSTRRSIIENVMISLEKREKKIALLYFQNSLLSNWMNHHLFKPSSKRVNSLKEEFDSFVIKMDSDLK